MGSVALAALFLVVRCCLQSADCVSRFVKPLKPASLSAWASTLHGFVRRPAMVRAPCADSVVLPKLSSYRFAGLFADGDADADGALPKRMLDPSERFKHARPLPVICQRCSFVSTLPKVFSTAPTPGEDPTLKSHSGLQCSQPGCGGMWRSGVGLSSAIVAGGPDAAKLVPMPIPPAKAAAIPLRHELEFCRASLMNGLISTVRSQLAEYSQHWMRCVCVCVCVCLCACIFCNHEVSLGMCCLWFAIQV
jgi:hypothetical protein